MEMRLGGRARRNLLLKACKFLIMSSNLPYSKFSAEMRERIDNWGKDDPQPLKMGSTPMVVRIRDVILVFNVLWLEGHLEPSCHFAFLNIL
jgi:hypothetical protein